MDKVNLFNHNVGIQDFLIPQSQEHIPSAKLLASTATNEISVVEHFNALDLKAITEKFLAPELGDGESLRPDMFNKILTSFALKYENIDDPEVQSFVQEIVKPMVANKELLQAYVNLMIGG